MKYKILKNGDIFPDDICLKGKLISVKNVPNYMLDYHFVKILDGIEYETIGVYRLSGSISTAGSNYDQYLPIDKHCKIDFDNNFFDLDKIICPII